MPTVFGNLETWQSYAFAAPRSDNGLENSITIIALQGDSIDGNQTNSNYDAIETFMKSEAVMGYAGL
ncbi:hypothetical protein [Planococcus wigleyi]|uniref:Uncharacterized protein n=1 Tax=Planococcus wigleyi TaxID=2762216 RepID=A0ABR8WBX0_9BACL|nr:hypothetical protein [Planococcus wigleyi]MBD8014487.1 hypothetical protein [Planococcus wigleyi]